MSQVKTAQMDVTTVRYVLVAVLVALVFFVSYRFAVGANAPEFADGGATQVAQGSQPGAGPSCACCSNGGTGEIVEGATALEGDVQRVYIDASAGFAPNLVRAVAGVPLEITFGQGFGCMAQVASRELGFFEDLTAGPVTLSIPALEPGEYGFSCGMEMVFGTIVVE